MSTLTWVVQHNLGSAADVARIAKHCQRLGLTCHQVDVVPFSHELPPIADIQGPALFYGATTFIHNVVRSGRWSPGAFFNEETMRFGTWGPHYHGALVSADARLTTLKTLAANQELADQTHVFVRPENDLKDFGGTVMEMGELRQWVARLEAVETLLSPDAPIVTATPVDIALEWRLFMIEGRVCSGSQYRAHGHMAVKAQVPERVIEFAQHHAGIWSPDRVFVMDIGQVNGRLGIIEVNGFNSSGFYASDIEKIVAEVSALYDE